MGFRVSRRTEIRSTAAPGNASATESIAVRKIVEGRLACRMKSRDRCVSIRQSPPSPSLVYKDGTIDVIQQR